ncbi:MAG TPA: NADAR family protein [Chthonomonadaceae bacterium]|nr:NADAR family protein [Chthonomonadaceae bacterium]
MTIYFYGCQDETYGCFSNFSDYGIELDGAWWPTTEHYFQAQKFVRTDADWAEKIRLARTPGEAKQRGGNRSHPICSDWNVVRDEVMRRAVRKKFETHEEIRAVLLATGEEEIVENAPRDYYWGCGATGTGKNMLGQILMEVREALRSQSAS